MRVATVCIIFFALFCACTIRSTQAVGEDAIIELLEEIRKRMCHPIPKFGLPALDPFEINHVEYSADNKYLINFQGSVTNFRLTGLSDFVINNLKISPLPTTRSIIDVTLPLTAFKSLYTAKGSLAYILNLSGDGDAYAAVDSFRLNISWLLRAGTKLGIRSLRITITIGGIEIDFEKLIEEERVNDFFHALVNELGLELLDDIWTEENATVEEVVQTRLNSVLENYTIADIIKMIGGGGDEPIFGPEDPPGDCKDDLANRIPQSQ